MSEKTDDHPRPKTIRIICGEERALEIVLPLVNFTAYILSVEKNGEVPSLESMKAALIPSKISLAKLMATKLEKPIVPEGLSLISFQTSLSDGYFLIELSYYTGLKDDKGIETIENYNVILKNRIYLVDCIISLKQKELGRLLTGSELTKAIVNKPRL